MGKIYENRSKTGSSWVTTLPKDLFKAKGFQLGDNLEFVLDNGNIIIKRAE